jgi:hypothetical protein
MVKVIYYRANCQSKKWQIQPIVAPKECQPHVAKVLGFSETLKKSKFLCEIFQFSNIDTFKNSGGINKTHQHLPQILANR